MEIARGRYGDPGRERGGGTRRVHDGSDLGRRRQKNPALAVRVTVSGPRKFVSLQYILISSAPTYCKYMFQYIYNLTAVCET
ncbi:hypothetical protein Zmor_021704 [Zophobas morio]|uniref:Uncharacterized protein n=1 Tax=Zophobas morio TaxID=2755281 RepID=A0AA38I8P7_9CUCU|nr:hypothetical protein Zmor_021704 [Zophobas morio]